MRVFFEQRVPRPLFLAGLFRRSFAMAICGLLLLGAPSLLAQNTIHVKGRVLSDNGQPISKVSVVVKGTTGGVSTDDAGVFEINAAPNATLVFSSVGYTASSIKVGGRTSIDVSLSAS